MAGFPIARNRDVGLVLEIRSQHTQMNEAPLYAD